MNVSFVVKELFSFEGLLLDNGRLPKIVPARFII